MKRTGSGPTSSTTSRKVTNVPARFDIFTGSPPLKSFTSNTWFYIFFDGSITYCW